MKAEHPNNNPLHALDHRIWNYCIRNPSHSVAVDAGANEGGYTHQLLQAGIQKVHAYEPVPDMFQRLYERYGDDDRVYCNQLGLTDYDTVIQDCTVLEAWTLGRRGELGLKECPAYAGKDVFRVSFTTVDDHLGGIPVGIIKLDVDGYEHKVLAGASKTIQAFKPEILCEFSCYIERISGSVEQFIRHILHSGYYIVSMDGVTVLDTWEGVKPHFPYTSSFDVMLIHKEKIRGVMKGIQ